MTHFSVTSLSSEAIHSIAGGTIRLSLELTLVLSSLEAMYDLAVLKYSS